MLKKVTKDLPLHPIPLALKWDHISDLELADPEFRTLARIDLLLGAEVFASILCDGGRTGPRGTPSAMNTCLGSVFFGKIHDSDVSDVANYTLEQDELKYLTGLGRQLVRKVTSAAHDGGMDEWLRDYSIRDVKFTMIVEFTDESSTKHRTSQCARERETTLEKHLGNQGVSAGGMLAPYRH